MAAIPDRLKTTASRLGGYDFVADPTLGWRAAQIFWRPEVAADVVSFVPSPPGIGGTTTIDDLRRYAAVERSATDGRHLLWDDRTQLWVAALVERDQPLVTVLPFDTAGSRRMTAATNVAHRLAGRRPVPTPGLTRQAIDRFALRLRALDGRLTGASYRDIATALFGRDRVPTGIAWKTSDLRSRTLRLVGDARALVSGGYLELLR